MKSSPFRSRGAAKKREESVLAPHSEKTVSAPRAEKERA